MKGRSGGRIVIVAAVALACGGGDATSPPSSATGPTGRRTGAEAEVPAFCASQAVTPGAGQWQSTRVFYSAGLLTYAADAEINRIPDFSLAGYRYGEVPIPIVPEVARLAPVPGDNTARIQHALDQIGARAPDARGLRGAVVLEPGLFTIAGTVRVNQGGVVLRGSGSGDDPRRDTILEAVGDSPHQRSVVVLGSGSSAWNEQGARTNVADAFVQVGSVSLAVENTAGFAVGDDVLVKHPSTPQWLEAVGGGSTGADPPWRPGQVDIVYYRRVLQVSGNRLTLDAPVFNHLDRARSTSYVVKASANMVSQAGIEDLRVDIRAAGPEDEDHAWNAVTVSGAQDSWVRRVTALHFGYAGVNLTGAVRVTVADCRALDPVAIRTGGRMYNFSTDHRAQLVLFSRCEATESRHAFISNGTSTASGNVFHRCRATRGGGSEAGHRMWTTGILYDNLVEQAAGQVLLINRGDFGTSHGWGTAHSVVWRYNSEMAVQKPPTAQNYGISDVGRFRTTYWFPGATGFTEQRAGALIPESLYEAQLCERLRR